MKYNNKNNYKFNKKASNLDKKKYINAKDKFHFRLSALLELTKHWNLFKWFANLTPDIHNLPNIFFNNKNADSLKINIYDYQDTYNNVKNKYKVISKKEYEKNKHKYSDINDNRTHQEKYYDQHFRIYLEGIIEQQIEIENYYDVINTNKSFLFSYTKNIYAIILVFKKEIIFNSIQKDTPQYINKDIFKNKYFKIYDFQLLSKPKYNVISYCKQDKSNFTNFQIMKFSVYFDDNFYDNIIMSYNTKKKLLLFEFNNNYNYSKNNISDPISTINKQAHFLFKKFIITFFFKLLHLNIVFGYHEDDVFKKFAFMNLDTLIP